MTSIVRHDPASSPTNADSLIWRVTFSENVANVNAADFAVGGTTATLVVTVVEGTTPANSQYDVTASGGDLGALDATVTLTFAAGQDIVDTAANALANTTPTGTDESSYEVDNTAPDVDSATVDGTALVLTFDEDLVAAASLANGAFAVKKTPAGGMAETVTLSGAPAIAGTTVALTLSAAVVAGDTVTVSYEKPTSGSANRLVDAAGNEVADFDDRSVSNETDAPPTVTSIVRHDPAASPTNSNSLAWRVTFSEAVTNVGAADFAVGGTTATLVVTVVEGTTPANSQYDVTASGGDLGALEATVTLTFAAGQDIVDTAANALANTTPTGTDESSYEVDNTAPDVDSATVDGTALVLTFDEDLVAAASLANGAFAVKKTPAGGMAETVTLSGAPAIAGTTVALTLSAAVVAGDTVTVSYEKPTSGSANRLVDAAGNEVADFDDRSVSNETDAPPTVTSIVRHDPAASPTNSNSLAWRVTFSEAVTNVGAADFAVGGTTATLVVIVVEGTTPANSQYDVTASGGDLGALDATVTLTFAAGQDIVDTAANALASTTPTGTNDNAYEVDNTAPTVTSIERRTPASSPTNANSLAWRVTFSESVANVGAADFAVGGTTATLVVTVVEGTTPENSQYDATASGGDLGVLDATVTLTFASGQDIVDTAANALASTTPTGTDESSYEVDNTAPTVTSIERQTPASSPTNANSLAWRVTFSESVANVGAADFEVSVPTATLTVEAVSGSLSMYDVTASGGDLGVLDATVTLTFASGQDIVDTAANALASTTPTGTDESSYEVDNTAPDVDSATVDGTALVLTFDEDLVAAASLANGAFAVKKTPAGGMAETVTLSGAPAIAGTTVALTLSAAVVAGDTVTVSYEKPTSGSANRLVDAAGNEVADFDDRSVSNETDAPPTVTSIVRHDPAASPTNSNSLAWRVTFSEAVTNVGAADFAVGGTTATLVVTVVEGTTPANSQYDVTASGGDLGALDATVTLTFASGQDIVDTAANALASTTPTGTNDNAYEVDNTAPDVVSATAAGTALVLTFDEDLGAASSLANGAFEVEKTPVGGVAGTVTLSGTPAISGKTVTLTLSAAVAAGDSVTVSYEKPTSGSANRLVDTAGNEVADFDDRSVSNETDAPPTVTSIVRHDPASSPTNSNSLAWRVTFSEAVTNVGAADFAVGGTTATLVVTVVEGTTPENSQYDVTASEGDLGTLDATVTLTFAPGQDIVDTAANALASTTPTGTNDNAYEVDNTAPTVTSIERQTPASSPTNANSLAWRVTFSESVVSVGAADFAVGGTTATLMVTVVEGTTPENSQYDVTASEGDLGALDATVSLTFASGQDIVDTAANALASTTPTGTNDNAYEVDNTAPTVTSIERQMPASSPTNANSLAWRVTFSESVASVDAADFAVGGTTATLAVTVVEGTTPENSQYDVTASEGDLGPLDATVTLTFAPGQNIVDAAANALASTTPTGTDESSYEVDNTAPDVVSATVDGTGLVLTFDEDLGAAASLANGAFAVKKTPAGGSEETVTLSGTPAISGKTVTLTLFAAVAAGDSVTVSYEKPTSGSANRLVDTAGNEVADFDDRSVTNETDAPPTVVSIERRAPAGSPTNADSLTWRVTFSEDVAKVDAADFAVSGPAGSSLTVTADTDTTPANSQYDVTASGGNLANLEGTVTLTFAAGQDIEDIGGNALISTTPTGTDESSYEVDNTAPDVDSATVAGTALVLTFDEELGAAGSLANGAFEVEKTPRGGSGETVTLSGTPAIAGNSVTLTLGAAVAAGDTVVVSYERPTSGSANRLVDTAGNEVADFDDRSVTNETDAPPTVVSIQRRTPAGSPTNANRLTWRVTFSESVASVDLADFAVSGTTATLGVTAVMGTTPANSQYDVSASGGNLADLEGTVTLSFASGQDIADTGGNTLTNTTPSGTNDNTYEVDNTAPTVTSIARHDPASSPTNADSLTWRVRFSETVASVGAMDFAVSGTTATLAVTAVMGTTPANSQYDVSASGGNLADLEGTVTLSFASGQDIADAAGNALTNTTPTGTNDNTYEVDNTAPTVTSIARHDPAPSPTNANRLTWRVTFSESVASVDLADFVVSGTTATLVVTAVMGTTPANSQYDVSASGGNLADLEGTVTLSFASGQDIADTGGNTLTNTTPSGTNDNTYEVDNTAPTVTVTGVPVASAAPFTVTFTFSEVVTGFVLADITVGNGAATAFTGMDGDRVYTAEVTPTADGAVTVDVAVGAATDAAGNESAAAARATSTYTAPLSDTTAPTVTSIARRTPASSPTNANSLTWRVTFSESVASVDLADFAVSGTTATLAVTAVMGTTPANSQYDVRASGGNLADLEGTVTLSFASGQDIADTAGNALTNTTPTGTNDNSYEVDNTAPTVTSVVRHDPASSPTNANSLTWRLTFSESVASVDLADFAVSGTTATLEVTAVTGTTPANSQYDVSVSGGNLANLEGTATLSFATGQNIADAGGNALVNTTPTGTNDNTYEVDNTAPTVTYAASGSLQVGVAIAEMTPSTTDTDIASYSAAGLPSGLSVDEVTGAISGTPDTAGTGSSATVTVADEAGNEAPPVTVSFPAVAKGDQNLSGFEYSAEAVTLGTTAPTVTPPSGAETTLGYTAGPPAVCAVDAGTGVLTLVGAGACVVTATAAADTNWNEANATFTITVRAAGTLVLGVDAITGDDTINIAEKAAGFSIAGATGSEARVTVTVGGTALAPATSAADGRWSVSVPAAASYITGTSVAVAVNAAKTNYTAATEVTRTLTVDLVAPTMTSIERRTPASSPTNADSLTWRVRFSEAVANVDAADFAVSGTTATLEVTAVTGTTPANSQYDVTVSGGNLANLEGTATLSFATGQNIADAGGNALVNTTPTGTNDNTYEVDNTAPTVTYAASGSLQVGVAIAEMTPSTTDTDIASYSAAGLPSGLSVDEVTGAISGTPDTAGAGSSATVTVVDEAGNEAPPVTVSIPAVAKGDQNLSGFEYSAAAVTLGTTAPTLTPPTGAETTLGYTAGPPAVCAVDAGSGVLTLVGAGACVVTATAAADTNWNEANATFTITVRAAGTLVLSVDAITGDDTINIAEKATGFTIAGATGSEAGVTVTVGGTALAPATSAADGRWSVSVPAAASYITGTSVAVAVNAAKTNYTAATEVTRTLTVDLVAPTMTSIERRTPASSPTNADSLTWRVRFSEAVANVDAAAFAVSGTTATLGVAAVMGTTPANSQYDVTASGGNLAMLDGTVTLSFASGQDVADTAANALANTTPTGTNDNTYEVDNTAPTVTYAASGSLQVGVAIAEMTPSTTDTDIASYSAAGLPSGLSVDEVTGTISGTPDTAGAGSSATVTVADEAGNEAPPVTVSFPAVAKGDQNLSGFEYSAAAVTLGTTATTLTPPTGAETMLGYTASPPAVCTVHATTGVLTLVGAGACVVTATAAADTNWNEANATFTITVRAAGTLVLSVDAITGDDTINIAEKAAGFTIAGATGSEAGVTVTVTVGGTALAPATSAADGRWSVSVPAAASYITGTSVAVAVNAAKTNYTAATEVTRTLTVDLMAPTMTSIERRTPASSPTNADSLTWRVTFSESVENVDPADFSVSETTAMLAVTAVMGTTPANSQYDVTASGGNLAMLDETVTLSFASGQDIADTAANALASTTPSGTNHNTYEVDNTAPTVTYAASGSLQVGVAIAEMTPRTTDTDIASYSAAGLPSGLSVDEGTGAISGTPDTAGAGSSATVTVADEAGNEAPPVTVSFPAVAKGDQTLSGFEYSAEAVTLGTTAPTVTPPTGAETTLGYTAGPPAVCAVDAGTGVLTLVGAGACVVTATAAADTNWNEANATFTITVRAAGTLVLSVDAITGDDTINIAEKAAGFTIAGATGSEAGVTVSVTVGGTALAPATSAVDGRWSVSVPAAASYITGTSVAVAVNAAKTNYTAATEVTRTLTVDLVAPTMTSIERRSPASSPTNADSLTWRVRFSEAVANVDAADFAVSGTTATLAVAVVVGATPANAQYDVTASGGNLAMLDGTVTLSFASGQDVADTAANALANTTPTGTNDNTYEVDNTTPTVTYAASGSLQVGVAIAEMTPSTTDTDIASYSAAGLPSGLSVDEVTGAISGTPDTAGAGSSATVTVADEAGNEAPPVTVSFPAVAKGDQNLSGFEYSAAAVTLGTTAPTLTPPTGAETTLGYTAGPPAVCAVDAGTGVLTLVGAGACVVTATAAADTNWNEANATFTITVRAAGTLVLSVDAITGDDTINIAEKAAGFTIAGATGSEAGVTVTVGGTALAPATSAADGRWSVSVPAAASYITGTSVAVAVNAAKTNYTAATEVTRTLTVDLVAPTMTSIERRTPASSPTNADSLTWRVRFSEAVANVDAAAFAVSGTTATLEVTAVTGTTPANSQYDVTVSGGNLANLEGTATLSFATGQNIADAGGNALVNTTPTGTNDNTYEVDNTAPTVTYAASGSLQVGVAIAEMTPSTTDTDIASYSAAGLPSGLSVDEVTGAISGTPDTAGAGSSATVTVVDEAGNEAPPVTVSIPAVAKGDQNLSGFEYSAAAVTLGTTAPTLTPPTGAETTLGYTAGPPAVCAVDAGSGVLTLVGAGACVVTATAAADTNWNEANATFTITVRAAGTLVLSVDAITGDDTINIAEKATGFTIAGATGSEAGVTVTVGGTALAPATSAADGRWSVSVPAAASYITGTSVAVTVNAAKTNYTAATEVRRTLAVDLVAPTVTSVERHEPASSPTNEDSLTWRVTFSESVENVDPADYSVSETTATLAVTAVMGTTPANSQYDVTASGGDVADLEGTVTLSFAAGQDIADTGGNALASTIPTERNENTYEVDNTAPTVAVTGVPEMSDAPFTVTFTFSEAVMGFVLADIVVGNGAVEAFAGVDGEEVYTAQVTPTADGTVTVDVAAGAARDAAGNDSAAAVQATSTYTAPAAQTIGPKIAEFAVTPAPSGARADAPGMRSKQRFDALPDEAVHGPGAVLTFTLDFDRVVTVTPEPDTGALPELVLDVYGRERRAQYSEGSGSNRLTFRWTVRRGDYDPDGIEVETIALNGATIEDGDGNPIVPGRFQSGKFPAHIVRGGYFQTQISVPSTAREGEPFTIRATRDGDFDEHALASVEVVDSAVETVRLVPVEFHPRGSKLYDGKIADGRSGHFTLTPPPDGEADPEGERVMTIRLRDTDSSRVGADGGVWYEAAGTLEVTVRVEDNELPEDAPVLAVGPADVREPDSGTAPLRFRVCLWTAGELCPGAGRDAAFEDWEGVAHRVEVDYATRDGTARAGADYRATSGTLVFESGERVKTVEVEVLADAHDEGIETVWLEVSNPVGATIGRYANFGHIRNSGPIPRAWTARFGRTVAEKAIEAVEERFGAPRGAGFSGTLAGQVLGGIAPGDELTSEANAQEGLGTLSRWIDGAAGKHDTPGLDERPIRAREVLSSSAFSLTQGTAGTGFAAFWGRGAVTRFDGRDGALDVEGEAASAMAGADWSRDALLAGLMLSHSRGDGGYRDGRGQGKVESALTALFPYARWAPSERLSLWAMLGYGEGTLTLTPEGGAPLRPDLDFAMGALGGRSVLVDGGGNGPMLAAKSDALAVRTGTDAVSGDAGRLEAAQADVTRVRFALEGSRPIHLGETAVLTPSLEIGVRLDGGDAETGFGADIGAGLALSDPSRGFSAELRGRGLLTHGADGLRERGLSGTLAFDPAPETERGLSVSLTQNLGGPSAGGADALLEHTTLTGLGADDGALSVRRLDARIGYGFGVYGDRYTATPELGLGFSDTDRELRPGWRLSEQVSSGLAFEFGLEGTRRTRIGAEAGAEHGLVAGAGWRLMGRGTESFELRVEAAMRDAANGDARPEHRVGLRLGASW